MREEKIDHADVLLVSLGGNDGGFGKLITKSLLPGALVLSEDRFVEDKVLEGLRIAGLNIQIFYGSVEHNIRPTDVYWSEYPNLARAPGESPTGLIWHDQTVDLGIDLALITASAEATGALIGLVSFPFTAVTDGFAGAATFDVLSNQFNASPMALGMSLAVSGPELAVADRILEDHINTKVAEFCMRFPDLASDDARAAQRNDDQSRCEVIEIQEEVTVSLAKSSTRPQFNTFINSYREDCGGLDCSIHPTRIGYEEIYTIPVYNKLQQSYQKIPDVVLGVPSQDDLDDDRSRRTALNQKVTRENPSKTWPQQKPKPGDQPVDKNLQRFVEVVTMRAACEKDVLGISETDSPEDAFDILMQVGEVERKRARLLCSDPEMYEQYRNQGQRAKQAYGIALEKRR